MDRLSNENKKLLSAYEQGYRVAPDGTILNPNGTRPYVYDKKMGGGYYYYQFFSVRVDGRPVSAAVHRLQAYQKFGDSLFEKGIVVRHLNGNSLDNSRDNIAIGTQSENCLDRDRADLVAHAKKGSAVQKKLTPEEHQQLLDDRASGMTYKELGAKYGLAKSTISYIVRGITYQ